MKFQSSLLILNGLSLALLSLTTANSAVSRPLPEITPASSASSYNCYVVTESGRAFDLSSLCSASPASTQTSPSSISPSGSYPSRGYPTGNRERQSPDQVSATSPRSLLVNRKTPAALRRTQSPQSGSLPGAYPTNQNTRSTSLPSNWSYLPESYFSSGSSSTSAGLSSGDSSSGTVQVDGYHRKDGTYVQPHTRSAPGKK